MNRIIEDFSYLRKTNCKGVYLDNAATTLCPDEVIDYMSEMQKYNFVNINRGSYKLAEETFEKYKITHVILKTNTKLNMLISRDENYKELYKDNSFVIYERLTK